MSSAEEWERRAWRLEERADASDAETSGSTMLSDWARLAAAGAKFLAEVIRPWERAADAIMRRCSGDESRRR